jgi:predicted transcriptional regulator
MAGAMVSLRLRKETKDNLDMLAASTRRSRSYLMNDAIELYVERERRIVEGIKAAIEDVNNGRVISHEDAMKRFKATIDRVAKEKSGG